MLKNLLDSIKDFEIYRARQNEEMGRRNERLAGLVRSREESSKSVEADNGNDDARLRLDTADRGIAQLKSEIAALQKQMSSDIIARRAEILGKHEQTLTELDHQLQSKHTKQTQLKNVLIPRAEKRLASLQEQLAETQEQIQSIQKEMDQINHLNLDVLLQRQETALER